MSEANSLYDSFDYDGYRNLIDRRRAQNETWEYIGSSGSQNYLDDVSRISYFPPLSEEGWKYIVDRKKKVEYSVQQMKEESYSSFIDDGSGKAEGVISSNPNSCWLTYLRKLADNGFSKESINSIKDSCEEAFVRLKTHTDDGQQVKGLIVGCVQSGKTANMAGLIALAEDMKFNLVIVLSGVIESLRQQTEERFINDLNSENSTIRFSPLPRLNPKQTLSGSLKSLVLNNCCYLTVCLKVKKRLENLLDWLEKDIIKVNKLKILVIDDEADQASINTGDVKKDDIHRKAINRLIYNLVYGLNKKNEKVFSFQAMNYVCYTATPYANLLNEEEGLYPSTFIQTLPTNNEYFGVNQIFASDNQGLDVVRDIPLADDDFNSEAELIRAIHQGQAIELPNSLIDSLCWFLCCVGVMRYRRYKKPISMLVHSDQKKDYHSNMDGAIEHWIKNQSIDEIIDRCKKIYEYETQRFTLRDFNEQYRFYGRDVEDYPSFECIQVFIIKLLNQSVNRIMLNQESDSFTYSSGIHLCVDNSSRNITARRDEYLRLVYPTEDLNFDAPAFIVIGGNTLSRGLTIKGLVSSWFIRTTSQADTLMQMGRWFGYWRDYELLPRIWLSKDTQERFLFLKELDSELRLDLMRLQDSGKSPKDYQVTLKNTPKKSFIRITAKNKMQSAIEVDYDFHGLETQTVVFNKEVSVLLNNNNFTKEFLKSLSGSRKTEIPGVSAMIWDSVNSSKIIDFIECFSFSEKCRFFNQKEVLCDWIATINRDELFTKWNVVLAGVQGGFSDQEWYGIGAVTRDARNKNKDSEYLSISVTSDKRDYIADIQRKHVHSEEEWIEIIRKEQVSNNYKKFRKMGHVDEIPLLIIYRIAGSTNKENKLDYGLPFDFISLAIVIPSLNKNDDNKNKKSYATKLKIGTNKSKVEVL